MLYTSYWGMLRKLAKYGVEPVAISRGRPKGWEGRSIESLCPSWRMLNLPEDEFYRQYEKQLAKADPHEVVRELGEGDTAMLCWEKEMGNCHRSKVVEWLERAGYEVEEFDPAKAEEREKFGGVEQLTLF